MWGPYFYQLHQSCNIWVNWWKYMFLVRKFCLSKIHIVLCKPWWQQQLHLTPNHTKEKDVVLITFWCYKELIKFIIEQNRQKKLTPQDGVPRFDSAPASSPIFSVPLDLLLMQYGVVPEHSAFVLHLHAPVLVSQVLEAVLVHEFALH